MVLTPPPPSSLSPPPHSPHSPLPPFPKRLSLQLKVCVKALHIKYWSINSFRACVGQLTASIHSWILTQFYLVSLLPRRMTSPEGIIPEACSVCSSVPERAVCCHQSATCITCRWLTTNWVSHLRCGIMVRWALCSLLWLMTLTEYRSPNDPCPHSLSDIPLLLDVLPKQTWASFGA